jgi:glutamate synthase domain-containing protein 3
VVVLGRTGRNFAAGMSGGIAYVLDEDGTFAERCNLGMVGFDEISEWDATELRGLVEEHAQRTGSRVARRVLDAWADTLPLFVKVMPHDYKRVLAELAAEGDGVVDHDGHEMSTSGEGFVITETEELETR